MSCLVTGICMGHRIRSLTVFRMLHIICFDEIYVISWWQCWKQHAISYMQGGLYYGAQSTMNVWSPSVQVPSEFSLSQMWLLAGSFSSDLNSIEAGWQVSEAPPPALLTFMWMLYVLVHLHCLYVRQGHPNSLFLLLSIVPIIRPVKFLHFLVGKWKRILTYQNMHYLDKVCKSYEVCKFYW